MCETNIKFQSKQTVSSKFRDKFKRIHPFTSAKFSYYNINPILIEPEFCGSIGSFGNFRAKDSSSDISKTS